MERRAPSPAFRLRQRAELVAARFPALMLEAERVAATVSQGVHGRRRTGVGESFWQFRRYQPGDSADRIDWRQSAKSGKVYVRETEWEAAQTLYLWADASASMNYASAATHPAKRDRAELLVLALASLALRGGERVGLVGGLTPPVTGKGALRQIGEEILRQPEESGFPNTVALPRFAAAVLFSDFLLPFAEIREAVRRLASSGVKGCLVQILDPAEIEFPFAGRTRIEGTEGEEAVLAPRAEGLRVAYQARLAALQADLAGLARAAGWDFMIHSTDSLPHASLMQLVLRLEQRREAA